MARAGCHGESLFTYLKVGPSRWQHSWLAQLAPFLDDFPAQVRKFSYKRTDWSGDEAGWEGPDPEFLYMPAFPLSTSRAPRGVSQAWIDHKGCEERGQKSQPCRKAVLGGLSPGLVPIIGLFFIPKTLPKKPVATVTDHSYYDLTRDRPKGSVPVE